MATPSEAQFDFDIGRIDFWAQPARVRDEAFAQLRREAPVSHHGPPEDALGIYDGEEAGYWAIARYDDIKRISRDPKTFQSGKGVLFGEAPPEMLEASQSFLAMDAPRHTKLRGLVSAAFTPRRVARIEEGIRSRAKEIVAEAVPHGEGDFVELVAKRLPLVTISDMVGVPDADRERVVEAADVLVTVTDPEVSQGKPLLEVMGTALWTLTEFATELAKEREAAPKDDLMTALVESRVDGDRLTHAEIAAFFVLLSVAGNDTTRHTTSHGMKALTDNPDQRAILLGDLEATTPAAAEEMVRWASPVTTFTRTATRDVELHGQEISAGEQVALFYHSGNRDEEVWQDAWTFDVTRDPNRHLGFGGGGPHYCLGASLARTQLRAIFTELLIQAPGTEVGEPEMYRQGAFIHGVKRLPCSFG
ncbi:MAG: cytochrome P450 [Thermoleophilaceae bacterium]|nr:cytochrome P450 [Thermoleophilaceae bacterium]